MDKAILYIHGKGGNPKEAEYYKALFEEYDVIGFDYSSQLHWCFLCYECFGRQQNREGILYFSGCRHGKIDSEYDAVGECDRR